MARAWNYELSAVPTLLFPNAGPLSGKKLISPVSVWEGHWPRDAYSGRAIDPQELAYPPGSKLTLRGSFQRFEYVTDIRDVVKNEWLKLGNPLPTRSSSDFVVCLYLSNYLEGIKAIAESTDSFPSENDLALKDTALLEEEIRYLVKNVSHKNLHFVTDRPDHDLFNNLCDLRATVHAQGATCDFLFIHSFQKVAFSQNILYWWAAFLGRAREVYPPPLDRGLWSYPAPAKFAYDPAHYGIDLQVTGEQHWIYNWQHGLS